MTDAELIVQALVSHDRAAFGALVGRHQSAVRRFLRHLTRGNHALADDLAQDTFMHAWRRLDDFNGSCAFVTWLLGIAHNHWRNARRQLEREPPADSALTEPQVEPTTGSSDLRQDLAEAMKHLTTDEQLAVHLFYQQSLSHREISTLLGWPLGTVKTHLARGKEKLRPLLSPWNPQT